MYNFVNYLQFNIRYEKVVLIVRSWAGGSVLIVKSWAGGPVLIVRTAHLRISTGVGSLLEISYKIQ
jgi:hypothetical protein